MLSPDELYPVVLTWIEAGRLVRRAAVGQGVAAVVTALLVGQSGRCAELARALPSGTAVPARQRYKRLARVLARAWLSSAQLTPPLVGVVLRLVADPSPHLALDTVRCGSWEVLTIGVVWHGRALPIGWEVLRYPLPRGSFTPAVLRLLARVEAAWPAGPRPHLVADRGFPSGRLFRWLTAHDWGWTVRLRVRLSLTLNGQPTPLRDRLARHPRGTWSCEPAGYGGGRGALRGCLVVGRPDALPLLPQHQANAGSLRHRARRQALRARAVQTKHPGRDAASALVSDGWVLLFTSHTEALVAQRSYSQRWATEGTYRDLQGGHDGRHGWDLEAALTRLRTATAVDHLVGLVALGTLLQTWVGAQSTAPGAVPPVRAARTRWATTTRLSVAFRGRLAFTDPTGELHPWLLATLRQGAAALAQPPRSHLTPQEHRRAA